MEFLGYAFDAALEEPTIGSTPLDRLEARLTAAEEVDQRRENMIPVATWRALRAFRHGFPAVPHNDPTLRTYVEASADSLAGFYSDWARELHDHIFDPPDTYWGTYFRAIFRDCRPEKGSNSRGM